MILGGEKMIKTTNLLCEELSEYKNAKTKIQRMVSNNEIYPIIQGLYETNKYVNPFYLADPIYSPSYISFETALSFYDLIPERVYQIKNATFDKKKKKEYNTIFGSYSYQDIPKEAFPYGIKLIEIDGYTYKIATMEKALLDMLYSTTPPINNMKEMKEYLFENLRINPIRLESFNVEFVTEISKLYKSKTVKIFANMLKRGKLYDK